MNFPHQYYNSYCHVSEGKTWTVPFANTSNLVESLLTNRPLVSTPDIFVIIECNFSSSFVFFFEMDVTGLPVELFWEEFNLVFFLGLVSVVLSLQGRDPFGESTDRTIRLAWSPWANGHLWSFMVINTDGFEQRRLKIGWTGDWFIHHDTIFLLIDEIWRVTLC